MKNTITKFGLIAGAIVAAFMIFGTYWFYTNPDFGSDMVVGYAGMLIAFSFVFVGVKSYRDKHNAGTITFATALKIGLLISLIASSIYVLVWLFEYYFLFPDFMEKYSASMLKQAEAAHLSATDLKAKTDEIAMYKEYYKSPVMIILLTYAEILPVGIAFSLASAGILRKKPQ